MTKIVGPLLAVGLIVVAVFILAVRYDRHFSFESEHVELNAPEQSLNDLGLSADLDLFDARPGWLSDRVIRITPTLGVNFDLIRLNPSAASFARSFKVRTSTTLSDEEFGSATKHRYSYETGIQVYLSPTQYVAINYGKRYEEDSVATNFEKELRF